MARDWTIAGRYAPPYSQAVMQGANLTDPSNPEGNKLAMRAAALGLGALSRNPKVAATLYGVAEGGAEYVGSGSLTRSGVRGTVAAMESALGNKVLSKLPVLFPGMERGLVNRVVGESTRVADRYVVNPLKYLASALFSKSSAREAVMANAKGAAENLFGVAEASGATAILGYSLNELMDEWKGNAKAESDSTRAGAREGSGDAMVAAQTNSVPPAVSGPDAQRVAWENAMRRAALAEGIDLDELSHIARNSTDEGNRAAAKARVATFVEKFNRTPETVRPTEGGK